MVGAVKKRNNSRVLFLDIIRGVAAVAVMLEHVALFFVKTTYSFTAANTFNLGIFGVLSFFLVSGFIIPFSLERYKSIKVFFISRVFRIYPVYFFIFFVSLLFSFLKLIAYWNVLNGKILINFLYAVFFLQDYIPARFGAVNLVSGSWTLFIELVWYILFALAYRFNIHKKHILLISGGNLLIFFLTALSVLTSYRIPPGRPVLLLCCFLGLFVYRFFNKEINVKVFLFYVFLTLVNIYTSLYVGFKGSQNINFSLHCVIITYSVGFLFFTLCYLCNGKINIKLQSVIGFFANISYSLYLGHLLVLEVLWPKLSNGYLSCFIIIALAIPIAYGLHIYIENPGVEIGKKLVRRMSNKRLQTT